jgi:hypothetical protein
VLVFVQTISFQSNKFFQRRKTMKKTMKRVLAFVLTFLMCASLAAPVFAADAATCPGANADHTKQNCSDYTKVGVHTPACGEQGYTVYECNTCGKYFADDIQENEQSHVWEDVVIAETCDENGYEGKVCKNCGAKHPAGKVIDNIAGHNWTSSIDCELAGQVITVTCQNAGCGAKKDVVATGEHQWTTVPRIVKEPTCAVDGQGLAEYDCTVCGSVKQVVVYALKNHKNLENKVYNIPEEQDRYVAELKLKSFGGSFDKLNEKQKAYMAGH